MVIRTGKIYQYSHVVYLVVLKAMECKVSGLLECDDVTWIQVFHRFEEKQCLHPEGLQSQTNLTTQSPQQSSLKISNLATQNELHVTKFHLTLHAVKSITKARKYGSINWRFLKHGSCISQNAWHSLLESKTSVHL